MMERISRDDMLIQMAELMAQRGTCSRLQVGAIFSRDGRIIATGYNGAPRGLDHCDHESGGDLDDSGGCYIAEHAERNAIGFAARHGLALDRSEVHLTHAPCLQCSRSIINAGVVRLTFLHPYRITQGVELLGKAGIEVIALDE